MKKALSSIILITFCISQLLSQKIDEEEIYFKILDTLNSVHNFDFYQKNLKHFDTKEYAKNPKDTFSIIDPITYETITKLGIEFKIEYDSLNYREANLYKQRLLYPDEIFLIGRIKKNSLHREIELEKHLKLESYPNLKLLGEISNNILDSKKIGNYNVLSQINKIDVDKYKYAIKAYVAFSGIQWDTENKYCIVECGYHFRYKTGGKSGRGFLAILEIENNSIEIIQFIGLWEE